MMIWQQYRIKIKMNVIFIMMPIRSMTDKGNAVLYNTTGRHACISAGKTVVFLLNFIAISNYCRIANATYPVV